MRKVDESRGGMRGQEKRRKEKRNEKKRKEGNNNFMGNFAKNIST